MTHTMTEQTANQAMQDYAAERARWAKTLAPMATPNKPRAVRVARQKPMVISGARIRLIDFFIDCALVCGAVACAIFIFN